MDKKLIIYLQKVIQDTFGVKIDDVVLSQPPKKDMGDFALGGFQLSRELKKSPMEIVWELEKAIQEDNQGIIEKVIVEWPYLNIFLAGGSYFWDFVSSFNEEEKQEKKGTIIVDYIGANVGKPLHIGHMCTPNQGQAIINIYKKLWYQVISDSHIGDWGIIFGKLITAYKKYGKEAELHKDAVEHLFQLYVRISNEAEKDEFFDQEFRDEFRKLSSGDTSSVKLWSEFTKYSIESMRKQLSRINVQPDYDIWESFYEGIGLPKMGDYPDLKHSMKEIVEEMIEKGIAVRNNDNSVGVEFDEELKIPSCILQKRDGTHGYLASDLATIKYRMENWSPEKIIYSVDVRQQLHLRQVFIIAKKAGWLWSTELTHAHNGFISLKDGAMSTRKGRIIKLDDLLDEAEKRASAIILEKRDDISGEELRKFSRIIGIGAIKYGYIKRSRESDVVFDWDEFMTFEWNSAPYIQYAYVRSKNILNKVESLQDISGISDVSWSRYFVDLMKTLSGYREALEKSATTYHPHVLAQYCYTLTKSFNAFYHEETVLQEENEDYKKAKIFVVQKFSETLKDAFEVLGIEMPEKM